MRDTDYTTNMRQYAVKHDVPLVSLSIDDRHCTGPKTGKVIVTGPVPDSFARRVRELIEEFETRFSNEQ